jgi:hypothetical protein
VVSIAFVLYFAFPGSRRLALIQRSVTVAAGARKGAGRFLCEIARWPVLGGCHPLALPRCTNALRCPAGRVSSRRASPGALSVSIAAYVLAGSRLESAEEAGAAHFMEHITFKGTAAYPTTRAVSEAIEGVGGSFNAATDRESTVYWVRVPLREWRAAWTSWAS